MKEKKKKKKQLLENQKNNFAYIACQINILTAETDFTILVTALTNEG
jgi:hypothetical protein